MTVKAVLQISGALVFQNPSEYVKFCHLYINRPTSFLHFVCAWHLHFFIFPSAVGNLCMITGGRNLGRVGTVVNRERHPGSFDIVHIKDSQGHTFATR
jgi:hypothetical protein